MNGARSEVPSGIGKFVSVMYELICRDAWRRPTPSFARARPNERNHSFIVRASAGSLSRLRTDDRNEVLAGIFDAAHGEATDRPRRSRYGLMPFGQFWNYPAHMPSQRRLGGGPRRYSICPYQHLGKGRWRGINRRKYSVRIPNYGIYRRRLRDLIHYEPRTCDGIVPREGSSPAGVTGTVIGSDRENGAHCRTRVSPNQLFQQRNLISSRGPRAQYVGATSASAGCDAGTDRRRHWKIRRPHRVPVRMFVDKEEELEWERVHSWTRSALKALDEEPKSPQDAERKKSVRENIAASKDLRAELNAVGVPVLSVGELGNVRIAYPQAIPILLKHLDRVYPEGVTASILRALAVPYAGAAVFERLLRYYREHRGHMPRTLLDAVGVALAATASKADAPGLREIVRDPDAGGARVFALLQLGELRDPEVEQLALEVLDDPYMQWSAIRALRKAKAWGALFRVEPFLSSKDTELRNEAKKYCAAAHKHLKDRR